MSTTVDRVTNAAVIVMCVISSSLTVLRFSVERASKTQINASGVENLESKNVVASRAAVAEQGLAETSLVIIEFSDYECPYCGRFAKETYPMIRNEFVSTGKIRYAFRDFPLPVHQYAFNAAKAAGCAGNQGRYWQMHDQLFDNQHALSPDNLLGYSAALGLDSLKFRTCFASSNSKEIEDELEEAKRLGVTSTPTFLIGVDQGKERIRILRRIKGALPYGMFATTLREIIAKRG